MRTTARICTPALAALLLLAGCSSGSDGDGGPAAAAAGTSTTVAVATTVAGSQSQSPATTSAPATTPTTSAPATTTAKVSANNASIAELRSAFERAGIASAAQWAREVDEYRPYSTSDPSMAKLRQELAKYNPGPGVVDQIIATLSLP